MRGGRCVRGGREVCERREEVCEGREEEGD